MKHRWGEISRVAAALQSSGKVVNTCLKDTEPGCFFWGEQKHESKFQKESKGLLDQNAIVTESIQQSCETWRRNIGLR